jgi:hypothetical protein
MWLWASHRPRRRATPTVALALDATALVCKGVGFANQGFFNQLTIFGRAG